MGRFYFALLAAAIAAPAQKFEVASVKPNHSGNRQMGIRNQPGGRFTCENVSLKLLVTFAFGIRDYQVSGLPAWADSDRFDVNAKAEEVTAEEAAPMTKMPSDAEMQARQKKIQAMLQDLLADRFGMKFHRETKEMPVYALVVAKTGSKLVEAKADAPPLVDSTGRDGTKLPFRAPLMRMWRGQLTGPELSVSLLTTQLSGMLGRAVVDKTGLTGKYDIQLTWTPDEPTAGMPRDPSSDTARPETPAESGPSILLLYRNSLGCGSIHRRDQ